MSLRNLLKHRCTIRRSTPVNNDGVMQPAWSDVARCVPCLVQEGQGGLKRSASGEFLQYDAIGYFAPGTDIRPQAKHDRSDRLIMESPTRVKGARYTVLLVTDEAGMGNHLVAHLERLPAE